MGIDKNIQNMIGIVTIQIEGFFTERFINLCKINNIKIWDIRNIVKGVIRFKMNISDFKKLRKIARKTKCKVKIKEKKGLYFKFHKYRNRKLIFILVFLMICFSILFSTFVWNIDIRGNEYVTNEQIEQALKNSGLYVGRNKLTLNTTEVINNFRIEISDITWIGIELDGTKAIVNIVEKTRLDKSAVQETSVGDIVADKSGIITKVVPENGTSKYKVGSYIEEGMVAIEGKIYSEHFEPIDVTAKGIVMVDTEYNYEKEYNYEDIQKEYTGKKRYSLGISINSKEFMLNYLNKNKKYDINKYSKCINIFGNSISFDWYSCNEYVENSIMYNKEELLNIVEQDTQNYLENNIFTNCKNPTLKSKDVMVEDTINGILVKTKYVVNEQIGKFVERGENAPE